MLRKALLALVAACAAVFAASPAQADGLIVVRNAPVVPGHFAFAPLEVSYHKVDCAIKDQVAVTSVDQEFYNPNGGPPLEGEYIFPVPKDAQINKFTMEIDGKPMEAELLPADKARKIYEDIVRASKDPALLEYAGRAMFKVRIFPIEPHSRKKIALKYTEFLKQDANLLDYHYTLNTEKYSSKPIKNVSLKITIDTTAPITTLYSPTHEIESKKHTETHAVVGFEAKDVRPDTDFHLYIGRKAAAVGISLMTYKPDADKDGYFVLMAAPSLSKDIKPMPKDVVFVMDTSGSMNGAKIEQAKKALKFCVNTMNADDRFEIVRFSTEAEPFFKGLTPYTDENKKKALAFIEQLKATGGTAIEDAINSAMDLRKDADKSRMFMVVFLTDGLPTIGEQNPDKLIAAGKKKGADVRVFSFGIGNDVNTKLLDQWAETSKGYSQYVMPNEDIEVSVSNFFAKVQDPVIAGVKVDMASANVAKMYPKEMPDLFKGDQLVVFGTYSKAAKTAVVLKGVVNGKEETFAQDVEFADKTDSTNEWIAKLWATRRVGYLLDEIRIRGESKEVKDEVVELARRWGIVTPYTAMLIIEDERRRNMPVAVRSLREMEVDGTAVAGSARGVAGNKVGEESGAMAVSGAVHSDAYRRATSVEGVAKAAAQTGEHMKFADASGARRDTRAALDKDEKTQTELARAATTPGGPSLAPTLSLKGAQAEAPAGGAFGGRADEWAKPAEPSRVTGTTSVAGGTVNILDAGKVRANELNLGSQQANGWNYRAQNADEAKKATGYRIVNNYAQQNRVVNNRAFFLNGNQWTDNNVQQLEQQKKAEKKISIKFGSTEYFDLLAKHPEASAYMALGNNVTFEIEGKIYDIVDETPAK